jgi:hypothetical protein
MKLPWTNWTRDQWWYFWIFAALLIVWPGIVYRSGSTNIAAVIYWLTALIVLAYTVETYGMRSEMVAVRVRQETPEVVVRLEHSSEGFLGFFDVVVENVSDAPALSIQFQHVPDLTLPPGNRQARDIGFLKHGISYLPPKQSTRAFFLAYRQLTPEQQHSTVAFKYTFRSLTGFQFERTVPVSLASYYDVTRFGVGFQRDLLTALEALNTSVKEVSRMLRERRTTEEVD